MRNIFFIFCILIIVPALCSAENILKNGSFEEVINEGGQLVPQFWQKSGWDLSTENTWFNIETNAGVGGNAVSIINKEKGHSYWTQEVWIDENTNYKLSAWIKSAGVHARNYGASIGISGRNESAGDLRGDNDWRESVIYIRNQDAAKLIKVMLSLGHYGNLSAGTAYFDNVSLEKVESIPQGEAIINYSNAPVASETEKKHESRYWVPLKNRGRVTVYVAIALLIIVSLLIYYALYDKKRNQFKTTGQNDLPSTD